MLAFGVICATLVAATVIFGLVGLAIVGLGFGGPTLFNWAWAIILCALAILIGYLWWYFVTPYIHFGIG